MRRDMNSDAYDVLVADLEALGRGLPGPGSDSGLTLAVMDRLSRAPAAVSTPRLLSERVASAFARRRRQVAVAAAALLVALVAAPPVRAAVADWFGFAGVVVRQGESPRPNDAPPSPTLGTATDLDEARELFAFEPALPEVLGPPQAVEVSADRRVLSMRWTDAAAGAVRLDQFDGRLDYTFAKQAPGVEFTAVKGDFALWFDEPHEVVVLAPDGTRRTETARLAGHTLIWEHADGSTLRLEGDLTRARALEIADSVPTASP